jgi:WD40 repeat protein
MIPFLPPLPPLPPGVRFRLGDPRLASCRGVEQLSIDLAARVMLLRSDDLLTRRDLDHYEERPGGSESSAPPFVLSALVAGQCVIVDGNTLERSDARTEKKVRRSVRLTDCVAAAIDPLDRVVACMEKRGRLRVFDAARHAELGAHPVPPAGDKRTELALSSGGELALLLGEDVRMVVTTTGETLWTRPRADGVGAAFVDAERVVLVERTAATSPGREPEPPVLHVLSARTGAPLVTRSLTSRDTESRFAIGVTADGRTVAIGLRQTVELWDLPTATRARELAVPRANQLQFQEDLLLIGSDAGVFAFSRDGSTLRSPESSRGHRRSQRDSVSVRARTVALADAEQSGVLVMRPDDGFVVRLPIPCWAVALSPDGTRVLARGDVGASVHRVSDGQRLFVPEGLESSQTVAWGGTTIVASGLDEHLRVVSGQDGRELTKLPAPAATVQDLDISMDGAILAIRVHDQPPRVVSIPDGRKHALDWPPARGRQKAPRADAMALRPDGRELVVGTTGGELLRFDTGSGALLDRWKVSGERIETLAVSDDGRLAAFGNSDEGWARVVSLADGRERGSIEVDEGCAVARVTFLGADDVVVEASNGSALVWSVPESARRAPLPERVLVPREAPRQKATAALSTTSAPPGLAPQPGGAWPLPAPLGEGLLLHGPHHATVLYGVRVGTLAVASGRLVAGDPMSLGHCTPLARRVPRGLHPVIAVVEQTDHFEPAALFIPLSSKPIARWSRAGVAGTDMATIAVLDASLARTAYDDGPDGELVSSAVLHARVPGVGIAVIGSEARNVALFATGADGGFPVYWGDDAEGRLAGLFIQKWFEWSSFSRMPARWLPCGSPPWREPARVPEWAWRTLRAVGVDAAFELTPLPPARLAWLEAIAGRAVPESARRYYECAAPAGLDAWEERGRALCAAGIAAFPIADSGAEYSTVVACEGAVGSSVGEYGGTPPQRWSHWVDPTAWLLQTTAEAVFRHRAERRAR